MRAIADRLVMPLVLVALAPAGCARPRPVTSPQAACALATERVTAQRGLPTSYVADCDDIPETYAPDGYYVLALRAYCKEALCGGTNMGWFAVRKADGEVFQWGVAEDTIGPRVPVVRR